MTATVLRVLESRESHVISAGPATSLREIARLMSGHRIGAVPIIAEDQTLLGLVAERNLVAALAAHGPDAAGLRAQDIMVRESPSTTTDVDIVTVAGIMTQSRARHLPVLDRNRALVGIISIGDVVKYRIDHAETLAEDLQNYVNRTDHAGVAQERSA